MKKYDLIIIGGGAAAFSSAIVANKLKKKALMVNDSKILPIGGTCVNVGCIPSKILLHQAHFLWRSNNNKFKALEIQSKGDFISALKETSKTVNEFRKINYEDVLANLKHIEFIEGFARFVDKNKVKVIGETYEGKYFLIATGAQTFVPNIEGIEKIDFLTNSNILHIKKKPESVIILGGGPLGCEFAQIFNRFGIKVYLVQKSERLLPRLEPLLGENLKRYFEEEGIKVFTGANVEKVKKSNKKIKIFFTQKNEKFVLEGEQLFLATGIRPNTSNLGLENTQVKVDERGFILVNKHLRTSQKNIFAAGDVTGILPLETVAAKQGRIATENMFKIKKESIDYVSIPKAIFTQPEVASVGLKEEEVMEKYGVCSCKTISFSSLEKARAIKESKGYIKMVIHPRSRVVLGVHIIGPLATETISIATYIVKNKLTLDDILETTHPFPTIGEIIKKVAQSFYYDLRNLPCCIG